MGLCNFCANHRDELDLFLLLDDFRVRLSRSQRIECKTGRHSSDRMIFEHSRKLLNQLFDERRNFSTFCNFSAYSGNTLLNRTHDH